MNKKKYHKKEILKALIFVLPYIVVEFTNTVLIIIDRSISNSIGKTAIIVFSSFITLNWAINTIQGCIASAHRIVLVRDKENSKDINATGIAIELILGIITSLFIYLFAEKITYIYNLESDARNILTIILKLKAIQLPFYSIGYIPGSDLQINKKNRTLFIITLITSFINITGDLLSIKLGYNEVGIYVATLISTLVSTILLFIAFKFNIGKVSMKYVKEIIKYSKDLIFNKVIQRIVNIVYTRIASSFGTNIYAIHCACITVSDTITEIAEGYYSGLLVIYSNDIENEEKELINKVDTMEVYGIMCSIFISIVIIYPTWWLLGRAIPWKDCNPYIWLYALEFVASVGTINYQAYVSAKKDTKAIRNIALIGGICVRIPLVMIVKYANLGLIGLSVACGIDRIIRTIYLRLYIRKKLIKEETIVLNKKIEVKV